MVNGKGIGVERRVESDFWGFGFCFVVRRGKDIEVVDIWIIIVDIAITRCY